MSNYNEEYNMDNLPDTSDTFKIVIFTEGDRDNMNFLDGLPYYDATGGVDSKGNPVTGFPTQATDFAGNNPIIGGKPVEYLIVVGSGNTQIQNAFTQVTNAVDQNGDPFVQDGTKLFVMGHASRGDQLTGRGGKFGGVSPAGWKTIIQDTGLYDKFDEVAYGACQQGEDGSCVNLSFAFGTDTKVIAQTDYRWGEGSTASAFVNNEKGGDWSKTQAKNPADSDGTFADAVHSINSGQVITTGYDRKQTKFATLGETPFKLDGDPRLDDIGYTGVWSIDEEEQAAYDAEYETFVANEGDFGGDYNPRPDALEEPTNMVEDAWSGALVSSDSPQANRNKYEHGMRAYNAESKAYLDETYGTFNEDGALTGHTIELEQYTDEWSGDTVWKIPDADMDSDQYYDWIKDRTDQTEKLFRLAKDGSGNYAGDEAITWEANESGRGGTVNLNHTPNSEESAYIEKMADKHGWIFDPESQTIDLPNYEYPASYDPEGNQLPMFTTYDEYNDDIRYVHSSDVGRTHKGENYVSGLANFDAKVKYENQQYRRAQFQQGTEWDTYHENASLLDRWDAQYSQDVETILNERGIYQPEKSYEKGTMLLDSDNMIPSLDTLVADPGSETTLLQDKDLHMEDRVYQLNQLWEDRNPVALDAFNQAEDKLINLGIEPNTAYWDKLIGLEALSIYAASDNQ